MVEQVVNNNNNNGLCHNTVVLIHSLKGSKYLNQSHGLIFGSFISKTNRWPVISLQNPTKIISIRSINLIPVKI